MNASHHPEAAIQSRPTHEQVAGLLHRYPGVSEEEAKAILAFLRKGRHLDVGILTADDRLKPQLDSFVEDHAKHLRLGFGEVSAVLAGIAGFLGACWIAWEFIKPAALTI
jgi:hypothetical protein